MKSLLTIIPLVILLCFAFSCQQGEEVAEVEEDTFETKTGFAEVNGTRLYYEIASSGEPIVLIHGNFGDCRHWDYQLEPIAKSHKVIRYDVRGFGKSNMPVQEESYSHHEDLRALLGYLGISKANIAGFSMGCGIAVDFVLAYPEISNSLIAVGPWVSGYNSQAVKELYQDMSKISSILEENGTKAAAEFCTGLHFLKPKNPNPEIEDKMRKIIHDYSFWGFLNKNPVRGLSPQAIQQIEKISLPTLIITAEYDHDACREIANLLEQTIPNSIKVDIADTSHLMAMEKAEEFNKAVIDFLNRIE